ncbi:hypothetical protein [Sphingomonas morindae]|uniref:Flagellar assembly protein FliH n=1 Tax=Sphingomonas morindae TaxID=1541170 RepID=A0ABY4X9S8_9SPHN|nr:hypothetical protein [Sphingomonas morindae]USI73722.1 hypothetical protein LHA26_04420 [Sphingomonas morindae]
MSNLLSAATVADAAKVSIWTRPPHFNHFTAWGSEPAAPAPAAAAAEMPEACEPPAPDIEALRHAAFADGYEQGIAAMRAELEQERAGLARLAVGLEALRPEPVGPLGVLIAATVERLVTEIMGTVTIDPALLLARAEAAAAVIGEETQPAVLKLHPEDLARLHGAALPVAAEADPTLAPGALRLETAAGSVEDSPALRLARLRGALDRVAAAR